MHTRATHLVPLFALLSGLALPLVAHGEETTSLDVFCAEIRGLVDADREAIRAGTSTPRFYHPEFERTAYRRGKNRKKQYQAFTNFRIENYGQVTGAKWRGEASNRPGSTTARSNSIGTTFLGLRVRINRDVEKALRCVERDLEDRGVCESCEVWKGPSQPSLKNDDPCDGFDRYYLEGPPRKHECEKLPYNPRRLSGIRHRNSFRGWEFSNHLWGIAIDLDPNLNTCCKCVAKWRAHPKCRASKDRLCPPDRMAMPVCWIEVFENYGFRWLGWPGDGLEDTMHFEFLSDPVILRAEWAKSQLHSVASPTEEAESDGEPRPDAPPLESESGLLFPPPGGLKSMERKRMIRITAEEAKSNGPAAIGFSIDATGTAMSGSKFPQPDYFATFSGPPGGVLLLHIIDYETQGASVSALVKKHFGQPWHSPLAIGKAEKLPLAGADRDAVAFQTGEGRAKSAWCFALIPAAGGHGLAVAFGHAVGADDAPNCTTVAANAEFAPLLRSLRQL